MVYPGAGCIVMAIEAMRKSSDLGQDMIGYRLKDIEIMKAPIIPNTADGVEVQLAFRACTNRSLGPQGWQEFHVYSVSSTGSWDEHCKGLITALPGDVARPVLTDFDRSPRAYNKRVHSSDLFNTPRSMGIYHGPSFQNLLSIHSGQNRSMVTFSIYKSASFMPAKFERSHLIHPITLDALLQSAYAAVPATASRAMGASILRSIKSMFVSSDLTNNTGHCLQAFSALHAHDSQGFEVSIAAVYENSKESFSFIRIRWIILPISGRHRSRDRNANAVGVCLKAQWQPDLLFMGSKELMPFLSRQHDPSEATVMADLKSVIYHFIRDTLTALRLSNITTIFLSS